MGKKIVVKAHSQLSRMKPGLKPSPPSLLCPRPKKLKGFGTVQTTIEIQSTQTELDRFLTLLLKNI